MVVLLLDAMGVSILEKHLSESGFFRSHLAGSYCSVFPPTTVAATTAVTSGLFPCESGWLGWDEFFPELGKNVSVYLNAEQMQEAGSPFAREKEVKLDETGCPDVEERLPIEGLHAGFKYTPYDSIVIDHIDVFRNAVKVIGHLCLEMTETEISPLIEIHLCLDGKFMKRRKIYILNGTSVTDLPDLLFQEGSKFILLPLR